MSLIKCKECGKEISDQASYCPHCGCPVTNDTSGTKKEEPTLQKQPQSGLRMSDLINDQSSACQTQKTVHKVPEEKNSTLGILALIFSILGCTFIVGIVLAIIDLCRKDGKKKTLSIIALSVSFIWILLSFFISGGHKESSNSSQEIITESVNSEDLEETTKEPDKVDNTETDNTKEEIIEEDTNVEEKSKYYVGDTWQNKYLKITYTNCYEFTDYNQYNAPSSGNIIVCAEFEFENIGDSDETVMYTDFHGYADGYEVNQSYSPEGTGLDFTVKMSAGRKGKGIVAFEIPEDTKEMEIEFSTNFWTSENVIFVYE